MNRRIQRSTGGAIMSFFLQLKLLVWKNYTLRKRQWVGICHVIKLWKPYWISFSGSITRRDCLATHTLSNPLPCQTKRAEKISPWMSVWLWASELYLSFVKVILKRRPCPQRDLSHLVKALSAHLTIPVITIPGLNLGLFRPTIDLCKLNYT